MNFIDPSVPQSTPFEPPRGGVADRGANSRGHMGTDQLQVELDASMLSEAAEEISMYYAETAESKHVAERKKELARPRSLMSSQAIESYIEDAEDEESEEGEEGSRKLKNLVQQVMSGQGDPGAHARHAFQRPTSQYLALQYAFQQAEREGASEQLLTGLRDALDDLEMEHGPRIRADVNTIEVAAEGSPGSAGVAWFQSTYVDLVLGHATLAGTLHLVLDQFGEGGLAAGIERLQRALGHDLAAVRPSTDAAHLRNLVQDLYHLGVATTVLEGCRDLQAQLHARHGIGAEDVPVALMKDLVNLSSETWVSSDRFLRLAEKAGAEDVEPQINFLTGVKGLLREMPPRIFIDSDQRQSVITAAQDALDAAIDREEG
ncbi:type III secretion system gatekeeper subunit SctW [Ottowia thiooxydans]|uniref:type III secretion system gatekeeper subunit SctW n=1 Tax=Ottowia thiooxydans TaxID=219182 RepID=UPI0006850888|nr:type III secretion system gatekeeper subunit SctW [Ottowia thiooxydans]